MNTQEVSTANNSTNYEIISSLILNNDVSRMDAKQKVEYIVNLSNSLGLNPLTKPFQLIKFQGKEVVYATKDCTEQLRKIHNISVKELDKLFQNELYIVTAKVEDGKNRQDASTGVISIKGLSGDALANAIMKAETKAKRRATLSICGLGILDESETDSIGSYKKIDVTSGETIESVEVVVQPEFKQPAYSRTAYKPAQTYNNSTSSDKRFVMPFGKTKGKHFSELKESDLTNARAWAEKTDAKKFEKFINIINEFLDKQNKPQQDLNLDDEHNEFVDSYDNAPCFDNGITSYDNIRG